MALKSVHIQAHPHPGHLAGPSRFGADICNGHAPDWELIGKDGTGDTLQLLDRPMICALSVRYLCQTYVEFKVLSALA